MAATNVLNYMACIGARKVILWQRKLIRHSHMQFHSQICRCLMSLRREYSSLRSNWDNTICGCTAMRLVMLSSPHLALSPWRSQSDSKGLDTDFKRPVLALNTMPVPQTISDTSVSLRHAWSKFVPLSAADATLGKDFSLDTRQQKHHEEATYRPTQS